MTARYWLRHVLATSGLRFGELFAIVGRQIRGRTGTRGVGLFMISTGWYLEGEDAEIIVGRGCSANINSRGSSKRWFA